MQAAVTNMEAATYTAVFVLSILVTVIFLCMWVMQCFSIGTELQPQVMHQPASVTMHERIAFHALCVSTPL